MAFHYVRYTALLALLAQFGAAQQQSRIIPQDLQGGLSGGTPLQVSYTNEAVNGFRDGTSFSKDAVSREPTFALGDSAGIAPSILYTIIMVDTTCPNKRVLHYARANFKNNFDITNIDTQSAALLDYKAPGEFGETGDNRQYSFLMYVNPGRREITTLQLPAEGDAFDVEKFKTDNGFQDATGGVGMVVNLGGQADCDGDQPNALPSNLPSAAPPRSSAAGVGSASRTSPTSTAAGPRGSSSAANAGPTPSSSPNNNGSNPGNSNDNNDGQNNAPAISTIASSAGSAGGAQASRSTSADPAQQTTSSASALSAGVYGMLASLSAIAAMAIW